MRELSVRDFYHCGQKVSRNTFLLHRVGSVRLKALKSHCLENGLVPRMHGSTGRVPPNALSLEDVQLYLAAPPNKVYG